MPEIVVEVTEGKLEGKQCITDGIPYYVFKGIPFAKPPVDELRFSLPQPPEPWAGIRDATAESKFCAQYDSETETIEGQEDCLYMNIYTPKLPATRAEAFPVMFFIHGGGFVFGSGTDDSKHGPQNLIKEGVVVVSINYRLGILGFLSLDCKEAPGNMGLHDQVQALRWVQRNIAVFGGDPENVTIFGISAGGASVEYLLLSPLARGLFHKAIAQAGSSLLPWAYNENVKRLGYRIPALKGINITVAKELYKYLLKLPYEELVKSAMAVTGTETWKGGIYFGFVPTMEKPGDWVPFLSKKPIDILKRGEFTKVPFISGCCSKEGLLMPAFKQERFDELVRNKDFLKFFPFHVDSNKKPELEKKLRKIYLEAGTSYSEPDDFAIDYFSDVDFICGIHYAVSEIAKHNPRTYFYQFSYDGGFNYLKKKMNIDRPGACHGDDIGYIIKTENLVNNITATDILVRDRMIEMWTNFAKYGEPTPSLDKIVSTRWEPITDTVVTYLEINDQLTMRSNLLPDRINLYKPFFDKTCSF